MRGVTRLSKRTTRLAAIGAGSCSGLAGRRCSRPRSSLARCGSLAWPKLSGRKAGSRSSGWRTTRPGGRRAWGCCNRCSFPTARPGADHPDRLRPRRRGWPPCTVAGRPPARGQAPCRTPAPGCARIPGPRSARQRGGGQHPHRHSVSSDPGPEPRKAEGRAPPQRDQMPLDQAVCPLAPKGREDVVVVGSAWGERAVDRQRVAGSEEGIEPPLGATAARLHRATRCTALPTQRVCRVHQTLHLWQGQIVRMVCHGVSSFDPRSNAGPQR
jgi:hypothetical protein